MDNRLIESRGEFHEAVREAFAELAHAACPRIWLSDPDFSDWPWSEPAVVANLQQWALSHREMRVLALHYDEVARRHARWVAWRRQWAHVVHCHAADEQDAAQVPTLLLAPGVCTLRLVDRVNYRGRLSVDPRDAALAADEIDGLLQRGSLAFPATALGL